MNTKKTIFVILGVIILAVIVVGAIFLARGKSHVDNGSIQVEGAVTYVCKDSKTILAKFDADTAFLAFNDRNPIELVQTASADGARYANSDESFVFWSKGNGALVLENNTEKSYIGCINAGQEPAGSNLSTIYRDEKGGFLLRFPTSPVEGDHYAVSKDGNIVKFTIPKIFAEGNNLSKDSYISIEMRPKESSCTADKFSDQAVTPEEKNENGVTYSYASSEDAGAGNRYDQMVYAIPGTNPCVAVRYFIHYTNIENYDPGTISEFDRDALIKKFDQIRSTLVLNQ